MHATEIPTLADLLSPVDLDTFIADYWEKRPLHVPGPGRNFDAVLSLADIDTVLSYTGSPNVPPYSIAHAGPTLPRFDAGSFLPALGALRDGSSLLIGSIHLRWPPIAALCAETQATLRHPIGATIVLTPGNEQGLPLHYDLASVFAMQLYGEKEWLIWEPIEDKPLRIRPLADAEVEAQPCQRILMRPGDVLYVPRGQPHRCLSGDGTSLHLSMYVDPLTWRDLLVQALDDVTDRDARFRQALPVGFAASGEVPEDVVCELSQLLSGFVDQAGAGAAAERLTTTFIGQMKQLPGGAFVDAIDVSGLTLDSVLQKSPGAVCAVRNLGLSTEFQYSGGTIAAPLYLRPALCFIAAAGGPFAVRDLPGLEEEEQLVLARRLVREAFLHVKAN